MFIRKAVVAFLALIATLGSLAGPALAQEWENPKAKVPPQGKPTRMSAAEGMPPLPLPATPLRRSEKKREPAPPGLVGMLTFGQAARVQAGQRVTAEAFPTTQIDIERLMNFANNKLNIRYRFIQTQFSQFSWDPSELPLLYLTGWRPMPKLDDATLEKLRRYIYDGGTLVVHAQCGRKEFIDSARVELARLFPDRQLAPLDTDSPLFHSYYNIDTMRVYKDAEPPKSMKPYLEAIYLGCRPAVIFSPIDINCGWDVVSNPIPGGVLYHQDDGLMLGVNIITCVLADFEYAKAFGTQKVYHQQGQSTRDQLVIAQLVHNGDWDPTPQALPSLMKYIQTNTRLNVQFKREAVPPGSTEIFKHPILYITGLRDFKLSDAEVQNLRGYIQAGGLLVADAAAGHRAFDAAFRREIKRVIPDKDLARLPLEHAIYTMPNKVGAVSYTALVAATDPSLNAPTLEGITLDGRLGVVYSPLSLANGWEQLGFAYNRGYADNDAIRLGVNIIAYGMLH